MELAHYEWTAVLTGWLEVKLCGERAETEDAGEDRDAGTNLKGSKAPN